MKKYACVFTVWISLGAALNGQEIVVLNQDVDVGANVLPAPLTQKNLAEPAARESLYQRDRNRAESLRIRQEKARHISAQRLARLDAAKWYGHSPLRPTVSSLPYVNAFSAQFPAYGGRYSWSYYQSPAPRLAPRPVSHVER
jgi:hypothetical protein